MSLIMDATRAAQREKERRESGANAGKVPLLVPLKSKGRSNFSWQRALLLLGSGGAMLAAGWIVLQRTRDTIPRALRTPGPTLVSIATPPVSGAVTEDTAAAKELARGTATDTAATRPTSQAARAPSAQTPLRRPARVAARPPVNVPRAPTEKASATDRSAGQLRVSVDEPRAMEVARLFAAGVAAHRAGNAAGARAAYEQVLALAPNDVDALNNLGVLHTGLREFDRAEVALRRALSLAPSNAGAWSNLGAVLRERGRSADAIAAFQHALSIDPHHAGARVGLAQQYLVIGSLVQARQLLDDVLRDYPASPEASYALGQVLERLGDRPGAVRAYTTFMRVAPPALAPYIEGVRRRVETLSARTP
jgi:tetratricopeptide (TPR) repeat protein